MHYIKKKPVHCNEQECIVFQMVYLLNIDVNLFCIRKQKYHCASRGLFSLLRALFFCIFVLYPSNTIHILGLDYFSETYLICKISKKIIHHRVHQKKIEKRCTFSFCATFRRCSYLVEHRGIDFHYFCNSRNIIETSRFLLFSVKFLSWSENFRYFFRRWI